MSNFTLIPRGTRVSIEWDERLGRTDGSSLERRKAGNGKWRNVIIYRIVLDDGNTIQVQGSYVRAIRDEKNAA